MKEKTFLPKDDRARKLCYNNPNTYPEVIPMFRNLFHPDSGLMITMAQITDCIFLSLFFLLGCFPVVTLGASCAALYDAVFHAYRRGDKHSWQRFWQGFRRNWKAGILPTAVFGLLFAALVKGLVGVWNTAVYGEISWMVFSGAAFVGVLALGILSVLFPMLSRFENSFGALLKNTVLLALANLPRTILLGVVNAAAIFLCARYVFPLFFLPALAALIGSLLIEPMFKPYMPNENAAG